MLYGDLLAEIIGTMNSLIKLKGAAIDFNVRTNPKKGISISAVEIIKSYVRIVGTRAAGGLSILARAVWARLSRVMDPCGELTDKSLEFLDTRLSDLPVALAAAEP